jgi:hypothetical protein
VNSELSHCGYQSECSHQWRQQKHGVELQWWRPAGHTLTSYPIILDSLCASNGMFGGAWNPETKVRDSRAKSRRTCQAVANEPYVLLARAAAERVGSSSEGSPNISPVNWVPPSPGSDRHDDAAPGPQAVIEPRLDLIETGTEFQVNRHGEDPRFEGSAIRVAANVLRDRVADV